MKSICKNCGFAGMPKEVDGLQVTLLIFLLLLLIIPGVIYMIFLALNSGACPSCGKKAMFRIDTPIGRKLAKETGVEAAPNFRSKADYDRWKTTREMRGTT